MPGQGQRYPYANELFLDGQIHWRTDPMVVLLVGTGAYDYNEVHRHLSDIPVAARIAMSGTLEDRTSIKGVADANDIVLNNVSGPRVGALVILRYSGTASDSVLISYQNNGAGLPFDPDGSHVRVIWDNTELKIFKL